MKIVFFGSSRYVIPVVEMLHNYFNLSLVVTTEQGSQDPIPFYCKTKKINFMSVRKSADLISSPRIQEVDTSIAVVADFGLIIPEETIKSFPMGMINIHPSMLPKYRGPSPVQSAILNGEKTTGVTIIQLDKYMDHGPIIESKKEEIKPDDTAKSLYTRLFKIGGSLLHETLQKYETQTVKLTPQDHEQATFTKMLTRDDGFMDIKTFSSNKEFFDKIIRAYYPWPGVFTKTNLTQNVTDEKIIKFLPVLSQDEPFKKIQVEGKREMTYKDFINGYPKANKTLIEFLNKSI